MGNYIHRIVDATLASEFVPVSIRMPLMRRLGYDVDRTACIWARASFRSRTVKIGPQVFINVGFFYDGFLPLEIGANVRIGQFVRIITGSHQIGPPTQRCLVDAVGGPVVIGSGCWIGSGVTILPGVTIGDGCVIAAGSLVTKSTEPNALYAGVPARLVRALGDDAVTGTAGDPLLLC